MNVIDVNGLKKKFGEITALDGIDILVEEGEVFGFLGPNGAGKTTTVKILCGILEPTDGQGRVLGFDIVKEREEIKRHIGYMAQHFGLYKDLTVEENIDFYLRIYGLRATERKSRIDELIEKYGLFERRKSLARELSGGLRQRLALICAMAHKPRLVFLDEPTQGADPVIRKELWDLFYELVSDGITLFITTHYMEEAERCSKLAFIFSGKIAACDTPDGIKRCLEGINIFEIKTSPQEMRERIKTINKMDGVKALNAFGTSLRVIADKSFAKSLGPEFKEVSPTVEDVFMVLTKKVMGS